MICESESSYSRKLSNNSEKNNIFQKNLKEDGNEYESLIKNEIEDDNLDKSKNKNNKNIPRFIEMSEKHYYYIDNKNDEWEYTEINGSKNDFYFKCSTVNCSGFGMINRHNINKIFRVTKSQILNIIDIHILKIQYQLQNY